MKQFFFIISFILFFFLTISNQAFAQNTCQTTDYCCDVQNPNNCGYAIFNLVNGVTTGYLCQLPVSPACRTAQFCDPTPYNCQVIPGGAVRAQPPSPTPTPTSVQPSGGAVCLDKDPCNCPPKPGTPLTKDGRDPRCWAGRGLFDKMVHNDLPFLLVGFVALVWLLF